MKEQVRRILRSPAAPLAIVATFGLGIGAATLGFALAKAVWLHPLPYPAANRIESVWVVNRRYPRLFAGPPKESARLIAAALPRGTVTRYRTGTAVWHVAGKLVQAETAIVGQRFFSLLGTQAIAGRLPGRGADTTPEAMIAATLAARFGGARRALGHTIATGGRVYTIVGVAPPAFRFPDFETPGRPMATEVWLPRAATDPALLAGAAGTRSILARLERCNLAAVFNRQLATITARLLAEHRLGVPAADGPGWRLAATPLVQEEVGRARTPALVLFLASLFLLGIAVTNTALLLLERAWRRRADTGVRLALGGGAGAILRGEIAETMVLALCGAGLGLCAAYAAMPALLAALPRGWLEGVAAARVDGSMVAFALALAALIALATGALVARRVLAADPLALVRGGAGAASAGAPAAAAERRALLAAEIALSVILAAGSIALFRSFAAVAAIRTGMRTHDVVSVWMELPPHVAEAQRAALAERILRRLAALPGVRAAAASFAPVLKGQTFIEPPARTALGTVLFQHRAVTSGYFKALGIPLVQGRDFEASDRAGAARVAIVNRAFALAGWKGTSPIGRGIRITGPGYRLRFLVVGVVGDARDNVLRSPPRPELYTAMPQLPAVRWVAFFLRTNGSPSADWPAWRRKITGRIWALVGDAPVASIEPLHAAIANGQAGPRFRAALLASFAAFGLLLAALGVYAVFACEVACAQRGIAVRLALGASRRRVMGGVLWAGARVSVLGVGVGVFAGFLALHTMHSLLFGFSAATLAPLLGAALLLGATALGACALATRRVFRVDVAQSLRGD